MDVAWAIDHLVLPAVASLAGGAGGYLMAAWRFGDRVRAVEGRCKDVEDKITHTIAGWQLAFDHHKNDLVDVRKALDRRDDQSSQVDLAKDAEFARFLMDEREKWERVQRTLGQIEGIMGIHPELVRTAPRPSPPRLDPRPDPRRR